MVDAYLYKFNVDYKTTGNINKLYDFVKMEEIKIE